MSELQSPFERLRTRLAGLEPGAPPIDLTVGAPRHAPPAFVADVLAANADRFGPYPAITGTPELQDAAHDWLDARYGLNGMLRDKGALLATCGSREGLFFAAVTARDLIGKPDPVILFANPYYQVYAAAAEALRIEGVPLAARAADTVLPDLDRLDPALLDRAVAYYVAAPSNPEGNCASLADWHTLLDLAEKHDFYLFADECYSEIYRERMGPPAGALTAAKSRPEGLRRLIAFNSLSKRSNLAGLRVGFVAGDRATMGAMKDFRNQAAPQVPVALQAVAAAALRDEAHVHRESPPLRREVRRRRGSPRPHLRHRHPARRLLPVAPGRRGRRRLRRGPVAERWRQGAAGLLPRRRRARPAEPRRGPDSHRPRQRFRRDRGGHQPPPRLPGAARPTRQGLLTPALLRPSARVTRP